MKIVVAMDSFKGSLTSLEAGEAVREGILRAVPACVAVKPMADGGEGTTEALTDGLGGERVRKTVCGPLGEPVEAVYGILPDKRTAVLEMASAAGITLVEKEKRDPFRATTYGVGELILDALKRGCREFLIGIGGSATTDGGAGMLTALGYELMNEEGAAVKPGVEGLKELAEIRTEHVVPELRECHIRVACDVTNPLCGEQGAVFVFGPQKGVTEEQKPVFDRYMRRYARLAETVTKKDCSEMAGAGAAGGLGFAFLSFLQAELVPGVSMVMEAVGLEKEVKDADFVVTGEGALDGQTVMGKTPVGVAGMAKKYGVPVIALSGTVKEGAEICNQHGIDAYFPIVQGIQTLEEAMDTGTARKNLANTAEQVFRLIVSSGKWR